MVLDITNMLWMALLLLVTYLFVGAIYRLYFSPLSKFPGPKLAALTLWYEFYFDVVQRGRFTFHLQELHEKYGPIIRINPYELHVSDPEFTDELYGRPGRKQDKYDWSASMFGNSASVLATVPHDHHRIRRSALSHYFSKQSVTRLEPLVRASIETLCKRIEGPYGFLKKENFAPEWLKLQMSESELSLLNKQFPFLIPFVTSLPRWAIKLVDGKGYIAHHVSFLENITAQVEPIMAGDHKPSDTHPTIFHELLSSTLPPSEKTLSRLLDEAQTLVAAGSITTAHFLTTATYHILQKLREELRSAMPDLRAIPTTAVLESLPYFSAVVKEGFRISYGITARLTHVSPDTALLYKNHVIPPGTPVGMTSILQHENESLFPNPKAFIPERWLGPDAQHLEKYLLNFSKGPRACLGMTLAKTGIMLTMAALFGGRFEIKLWETRREDADVAHDFFSPSPKLDSEGVRVVVK
ncbi:putative P450 monooxygenase [Saccharata proteae CBS 121410]|uniref:Putative P450 monooxygenase n=1 Tax=Saccharata proteae CBS 121410 TaxID=1314787 RepID=A0A6A5YC46_9PEZI|nr:putative P450 monooxygenase [Saccharata proteae CBS 121410]